MTDDAGALDPVDPREQLAELAAAVRAYVEWQADTGALGLPVEAAPDAVLALLGGFAPAGAARPARDGGFAGRPMASTPMAGRPIAGRPPVAPGPPLSPPAFAAPEWAAEPAPAPALSTGPAAPEVRPPSPPAPSPPASAAPAAAARARAVDTGDAAQDERRTRLALLAEEVRACTRCVLHEKRRHTVFSRGDPFAELMFIGEGPGAEEDAQGAPFVGQAGLLLDRMITAMGYARDEVYIANIVKCRPPNNRKPEVDEMASCMPYLGQQLALVKPRVIVALGATAVQGLCGTTEGITRLRGKWKLYKGSIPIMPTFHPAYLLRTPTAKREVWADLQEVMKHLGRAPAGAAGAAAAPASKPPHQG